MSRLTVARVAWSLAGLGFVLFSAHELADRAIRAQESVATAQLSKANMPGRLIRVQGRSVHVLVRGKKGPHVVLVHGLPGSTMDWEQTVMKRLAKRFQVVALDLWGFGFSERQPHFQYDLPLWVGQLEGVLAALQIEHATVVGSAHGAAVATLHAAQNPRRVRRLVLVSAPGSAGLRPSLPLSGILAVPLLGEAVISQLDHVARELSHPAAHHVRDRRTSKIAGTRHAILQVLRRPPALGGLDGAYRRVRARTLLLHGSVDDVVPLRTARQSASQFRSAKLTVRDGAGHFLLRDHPDFVADQIQRFATRRAKQAPGAGGRGRVKPAPAAPAE